MAAVRISLANLPFPPSPAASVTMAEQAVAEAAAGGAALVAFPEAFVPGFRLGSRKVPPPDPAFLEEAWGRVGEAAKRARITVALGTERLVAGGLRITTLVLRADGSVAGWQDKVQLDPSEDATYAPGSGRQVFEAGPLRFGVAICHEGWRYPETCRWAVRNGAHLVLHPQFHEASPGSHRPTGFAEPANTFHEKALLCRAAENTCYVAGVNYAGDGSPTTSAVVRPDGTLACFQPYGKPGLLFADLDLEQATGLLARRYKPIAM